MGISKLCLFIKSKVKKLLLTCEGENPLCYVMKITVEINISLSGRMSSKVLINIDCRYMVYPLRDDFIIENGNSDGQTIILYQK